MRFSGPLGKLGAESGDLDYRLITSDARAAARIASTAQGVHGMADEHLRHPQSDALVVRAPVPAVDDLVARLIGAGIAIRELVVRLMID